MGFRIPLLLVSVCLASVLYFGGPAQAHADENRQDLPVLIAVGSERPVDGNDVLRRRVHPAAPMPMWRQYRYPLAGYPTDQARADFDGDGCGDLVVLHNTTGEISVYLSKRNNSLTNPLMIKCPEAGTILVGIADLNGDTYADILITSTAAKSHFQLIPGKAKAQFGKIVRFGKKAKDESLVDAALSDVNGDGHPDIIALGRVNYSNTTAIVARNNGKGKFDLKRFTLPESYYGIAGGDYTGDGLGDLLFVANYTKKFVIYRSEAAGSFKAGNPITCSSVDGRVYPYDLDGNGTLDLIGAAYTSWFRLGRGNGSFLPEKTFAGGTGYRNGVELVDVNRDNTADFIAPSRTGGIYIHPGGKGPSYGAPTMVAPYLYFDNNYRNHLNACDFDGDKKVELLATHRVAGLGSSDGSYNLMLFEPDQSPATLQISNLVLTKKSFVLMFVYLTGSFDFSGENIDVRWQDSGTDPTQSAFIYFRYYVDFPWPLGDAYGYVRATGQFIHRPGEQSGTINFNFTLPTSVLVIGTLTPSVSMRDLYLYDINLVRSNELD